MKESMVRIPIYQVDAFSSRAFSGNPAAVCLLGSWLENRLLQRIAAENNLSETAFLVRNEEGYDLRWFTPLTEVALCGHATLASAFVLFFEEGWPGEEIRFRTLRSGTLTVARREGLLEMDFPLRAPYPRTPPAGLSDALGLNPKEVFNSEEDLLVVLENEKSVRALRPRMGHLERLDCRGVIVTAPGDSCDFVSRYFAPQVGIAEDPVTGSAHCVLVPYWAQVLGKKTFHAFQVSQRGGELFCRLSGDRVMIAGKAVLYMKGEIRLRDV